MWLHEKKKKGMFWNTFLCAPSLFLISHSIRYFGLMITSVSCDVPPQARCPRWCPCSRTLGTVCRLCMTVWPNPSVKSYTDSWTTVWMRKPWRRWVLKPVRPAPKPRTPCCTIGPCRSASARAHHAKRLPVSECTGPCASHRVRILYSSVHAHCMFLIVWECGRAWMLRWACVFTSGNPVFYVYIKLCHMARSYSTANEVRECMRERSGGAEVSIDTSSVRVCMFSPCDCRGFLRVLRFPPAA